MAQANSHPLPPAFAGQHQSTTRFSGYLILAALLALASSCKDTDGKARSSAGATASQERGRSMQPAGAKIDAQQAIAAATAAVPGSAREVRLESRAGKPEYEVIVMPKGATSQVRVDVDAVSGQVTRSSQATERDKDDDDDDDE